MFFERVVDVFLLVVRSLICLQGFEEHLAGSFQDFAALIPKLEP